MDANFSNDNVAGMREVYNKIPRRLLIVPFIQMVSAGHERSKLRAIQ